MVFKGSGINMDNRKIIGITGGIGSGKTAATDIFQELGITVVDADLVARQVVEVGSPVLEAIRVAFGDEVIESTGGLNRPLLRQKIFSNEEDKLKLNHIMHPAIRESLLQQLQASTSDYTLLSAPLLFENQLDMYVEKVIVIDVDESVQAERASQRDAVENAQIKAIIASQMDRDARLAKADYVIDNSQDLTKLREQVMKADRWVRELP